MDINSLKNYFTLSDNTDLIRNPLILGSKELKNRIAVQPMEGCDGNIDGTPGTLTTRRYERFAKGGAGLIWFEAVACLEEGRANPRQLWLNDNNTDQFKRILETIKTDCLKENGFEPIVIMQNTHSGRYCKPNGFPEPIIAGNNPFYEKNKVVPNNHIITDEDIERVLDALIRNSRLANKVGFDGVDIKACHGYLDNELLGAFTREGDYGGESLYNRSRLLTSAVKGANEACAKDFIVTSRLNIYDGCPFPYGFGMKKDGSLESDMTEPIKLIGILHNELNMEIINITVGNPYENPHINRPYSSGGYTPPEEPVDGVKRIVDLTNVIADKFPNLKVVYSGISYLKDQAINVSAGILEKHPNSLIGFGRLAFAYPDFAKELLKNGYLDEKKCCISCSKCSELMRGGKEAGCVIKDKVYTEIYKEMKKDG